MFKIFIIAKALFFLYIYIKENKSKYKLTKETLKFLYPFINLFLYLYTKILILYFLNIYQQKKKKTGGFILITKKYKHPLSSHGILKKHFFVISR